MTESHEPSDLAALITAVADNADRRAFARLFTYYGPRLKAYMQRLDARGEMAEELAQEVMLAVWRKAALFDPTRCSASAWVFTIARNLRIDAARRARLALPDPDPTTERVPEPAADQILVAAERAFRLRAALASLSAEQAEVIRLSFFDDRPHAEIERGLGIPLGTVKSRLRRALSKLRTLLDKDE